MLRDKQNKRNLGQPLPVFPAWVYERPALAGDFLIGSGLSTDVALPIGKSVFVSGSWGPHNTCMYVMTT